MAGRENVTVTINTVQSDLAYNTTQHYVGQSNFMFSVGLLADFKDITTDNSYVSIDIVQMTEHLSSDGYTTISENKLDYQRCGFDAYQYDDIQLLNRIRADSYYCPVSKDYYLRGNRLNEENSYIEIKVTK
jgi:hypothetical protein